MASQICFRGRAQVGLVWFAAWAAALGLAASCACAGSLTTPGGGAPEEVRSPQAMQAHADHDHDHGTTPQALAERQRLLDDGERRLRAGDAQGALQVFEQAALQAHEARIELGILRAQMQAGEYRHALAFAAHTAGVHLDEVQGRVFYAWLLNMGAQEALAEQTLAQAEATAPAHPMVRAMRRHVQSGRYAADGVLLSAPARLAPFASTVSAAGAVGAASATGTAPRAHVAASAVLLADGRHALAPQSALPSAASGGIWLRNGLGQTVAAVADRADTPPALGLVLLTLAAPLPVPAAMTAPSRDAFAGSPAYALDYSLDYAPDDSPHLARDLAPHSTSTPATSSAHSEVSEAAWPVMRLGFLGAPTLADATGLRRLGITLPGVSPRGGPVYDQSGRLIGVALRGPDGIDRLIQVGALRGAFGERFGTASSAAHPAPMATDELYEQGMKTSLQLLVSPP